MSDDELGAAAGEGIGLVLQNYQLSTDATSSWKVGIEGSAGELIFQDFWWMPTGNVDTPSGGSGCAAGTKNVASVANTGGTGATTNRCVSAELSLPRTGGPGATLGRVSDPIRFDVLNRATNSNSLGDPTSPTYDSAGTASAARTVMSFSAPKSTLPADRMDASYLMTLDHCGGTSCGLSNTTFPTAPTTRNVQYDVTRATTRGMDIDGSNLTMWAEGNRLNYIGQINFNADELNFILNEDPSKPRPGTAGDPYGLSYNYVQEVTAGTAFGNFRMGPCLNDAYCDNATHSSADPEYTLTNFRRGALRGQTGSNSAGPAGGGLEFYYPIGRGIYQPVTLATEANGNLTIELKLLPDVANVYGDFYENKAWDNNGNQNAEGSYNTPRGYVRIGSITTNWDGKKNLTFGSPCSTSTIGATVNCNTLNTWQRGAAYDWWYYNDWSVSTSSYGYCIPFQTKCEGTSARTNPGLTYTQVGPRRDFGYSRIEGIQIQYLKITTKGL